MGTLADSAETFGIQSWFRAGSVLEAQNPLLVVEWKMGNSDLYLSGRWDTGSSGR